MFTLHAVTFRDILAIPELTIDQPVTCITGPSGSGKTTLLRLLNRLNAPDSGVIRYQGEDLAGIDPIALRRRVVMMGQTAVLYPGDIRDNLLVGLRFAKRPAPDDEVLRRCLAQVRLDKALDAPCGTLSGGERQRLSLARVLLLDAACYLLDEPSSALDRETEEFLVTYLAGYTRERGKQLIMVTHSQAAVAALNPAIVRLEGRRSSAAAEE